MELVIYNITQIMVIKLIRFVCVSIYSLEQLQANLTLAKVTYMIT